MNLPYLIARKYFFSKKKKNFINIISIVSMVGVAVATMSLIIGLSFFNGLEGVLRGLYGSFDPQLKVTPARGKTFEVSEAFLDSLHSVEGVAIVTEVIEDYALAAYNQAQMVVKMKGVSDNFLNQHRLDGYIVQGEQLLWKHDAPRAIIGRGVQYALSISANNDFASLQLHYPRNVLPGRLDPSGYFTKRSILPGGFFAMEKQYDEGYIFVPLSFAQELTGYGNKRTALELQLDEGYSPKRVKQTVATLLGTGFTVLTAEELHADVFKILQWEKAFVFIALAFIIALASFNIFFSLTMLAIEKRKDVSILFALGATRRLIRRIFLAEGAIIGLTGAGVGLLTGLLLSYIQQQFGVVSMGMETAITDAFPVVIEASDVALTAMCTALITLFASYRPARLAAKSTNITSL